jgi:hypothetical protein
MLDSLKLVIKMHHIDRKRALNCGALINILLLAFGHAIFAGVKGVGVAGFATGNFGCVSYSAHLGRKLSHGILGNDQLVLELSLKVRQLGLKICQFGIFGRQFGFLDVKSVCIQPLRVIEDCHKLVAGHAWG